MNIFKRVNFFLFLKIFLLPILNILFLLKIGSLMQQGRAVMSEAR